MPQPSITFTAAVDCEVQVSIAFEGSKTGGGDFGASETYQLRIVRTASGGGVTTVNGVAKGITTARAKYADFLTSDVVEGDSVQCLLVINSTTVFTTAENIDMRVEVIKR